MAPETPKGSVPAVRIRDVNRGPVRPENDFILYWMTACRRTDWNFSLQRAADWCRLLDKPLLVLEALRCDYPWASERLHQFLMQGMIDNGEALRSLGVAYYPYIESRIGEGKGLLRELARRACLVVADDFPAFFLPRMLSAAAKAVPVRMEAIDSNGILPLRATDRVFTTAFSFRAFLQKNLRPHLYQFPDSKPLAGLKPDAAVPLQASLLRRWPCWDTSAGPDIRKCIQHLPVDHSVPAVTLAGGSRKAHQALQSFVRKCLNRYSADRNEPGKEGTSNLSPYLHFGHISPHEVFYEVTRHGGWSIQDLSAQTGGKRSGWWGLPESTEAFLDQLVTWRELGFNMSSHDPAHDQYGSLPSWARDTLEAHAGDRRTPCYALEDFESASTHDPLWNAAQSQLLREGRLHNYLRMLWGKKILEWSATPEQALQYMIELNNKYALDGRDPNSTSGIFWILGRYDRAWGPERPVFGKVRYMSSANTARKFDVSGYLALYGGKEEQR